MPKVTFVSTTGDERTLNAAIGESVMQVAISHGVDGIVAECGGSAMCATCHIYVDESFVDALSPQSEIEEEMLACVASERRPTSRLACQIMLTPALEGMRVHLPEAQQ